MRLCKWHTVTIHDKTALMTDRNYPPLAMVDLKVLRLTIPENTSATNDPRYRIADDGLYAVDLENDTFRKISDAEFNNSSLWDIEEHGDLLLAHNSDSHETVVLWKGHVVRRIDDSPKVTVLSGKLIRIVDDDLVLETVDGSRVFLRVGLHQTGKWMPVGMDSKGTVCLIRKDSDKPENILFARMAYPDYNLDVFGSCFLTRDIDDSRFNTDFRGTRVVNISSEDNYVRPIRLTSSVLKNEGLRRGINLIPDVSRFESYIVPMSGSKYILAAQGTFDGKDGVEAGIRPVMRLMDGDSGTMERKTMDRTEGQLYGLKGYKLVKISPAPDSEENGRIVAEFCSQTNRAIQIIDRNNNHFPAAGNPVSGTILSSGPNNVTIGMLKAGEPFGMVDSYREYDADMKPLSEPAPLNCRISMNGRPRYNFTSSGVELNSFEYGGREIGLARLTDNVYQRVIRNCYSIDDRIPLIIELESSDSSERSYPEPVNEMGRSRIVKKNILLCTLFRGMVCDAVPFEITVAQLDHELPGSYHGLSVFYENGTYRIEQPMVYDFLDTEILHRVTTVESDGRYDILEKQPKDALRPVTLDNIYADDDDGEKDIRIGDYKVKWFQGVLGLLKDRT